MTAEQQPNSQTPKAVGFAMGFLTVGIGIVKSVGPMELMMRAAVMAVVTSFCTRILMSMWKSLDSGESLSAEGEL